MIAKVLPEANWDADAIPIIYLPGVAKSDLRNVENAVFNFQPLLEYQYTGTLFIQENGREWSIQAEFTWARFLPGKRSFAEQNLYSKSKELIGERDP